MKKPWDMQTTPTMSSSFSDWEGIKVSTNPAKAVPFIMNRAKNLERRMRNAEMLLAHYSNGCCPDDVFGMKLSASGGRMKAQAYYQDARIIRIFSSESPVGIAELPLDQLTDKSADESLRRMGLQRVTRWKDMYFGKEATVRFRTSNLKCTGQEPHNAH